MNRAFLLAGVAGALIAPPAASADEQIVAGPPSQYVTTQVTIDQGERVTFVNNDTLSHDVMARDSGPGGGPLFRSEIVPPAGSAPVRATEYLTTGAYGFFCSLHPSMKGTLNVTSGGTPVPRPGGSGGGGDTTAPAIELRVLDSRLGRVRRRGAVSASVKVDEAATVRIKARKRTTLVAKGRAELTGAGSKKLRLKLTPAGERLARRSRLRLSVSARATDGAGNKATDRVAVKLR